MEKKQPLRVSKLFLNWSEQIGYFVLSIEVSECFTVPGSWSTAPGQAWFLTGWRNPPAPSPSQPRSPQPSTSHQTVMLHSSHSCVSIPNLLRYTRNVSSMFNSGHRHTGGSVKCIRLWRIKFFVTSLRKKCSKEKRIKTWFGVIKHEDHRKFSLSGLSSTERQRLRERQCYYCRHRTTYEGR